MSNLTGRAVVEKGGKRTKGTGKAERESPWFQYGTDKQFLEWISHQPSVIDGSWDQTNPNRNIACHYRKQSHGAGTVIKPKYCALPMTNEQHMLQERLGWGEVVTEEMISISDCYLLEQWIETRIEEHLSAWVKDI